MYHDTTWNTVPVNTYCLWIDGKGQTWKVLKVEEHVGLAHDKDRELAFTFTGTEWVQVEEV